jgi:glycosyltransferase involved in cell wall biosynthesis
MIKSAPSQRPLRIAIFTAFYAPMLSGVSIGVHQRVLWLLQQGHYVFLAHPRIDNQYPKTIRNRSSMPGIADLKPFTSLSSYAYPTQPLVFEKTAPEAKNYRYWSDTKLLEEFEPNVVVVEEAAEMRGICSLGLGGYGRPVGVEYAKRLQIPAISLFHTDWASYAQSYIGSCFMPLVRPFLAFFVRQFTRAYTVNFFPSRLMLEKYQDLGVEAAEYLPFQGIDCQKFNPENIRYNPIPEDPRPVLLYVGRLAQEKNVTHLLTAFSRIVVNIPNAHLVIVGSGPEEDLIRQQAQMFNSHRITVWGESSGKELLGWYARADLFINPSLTENFCTTNMEALASGTPVVAADAGGNSEQIIPGRNGFLSKPNDPRDLADRAISILQTSALRTTMGQQARTYALEFDWAECMKKFEERIYQLAASNPS